MKKAGRGQIVDGFVKTLMEAILQVWAFLKKVVIIISRFGQILTSPPFKIWTSARTDRPGWPFLQMVKP